MGMCVCVFVCVCVCVCVCVQMRMPVTVSACLNVSDCTVCLNVSAQECAHIQCVK